MKIIPTEIVSDILSRLPAESVLECKSVCKTWKNLIQQPSFPQIHLARLLSRPDSADSGKLRYVFFLPYDDDDDIDDYDDIDRYYKHLYYFEFNENEEWNNHVKKPKPRNIRFQTAICEAYIVIGSFNGLICMYGVQPYIPAVEGPAIIFNPVTTEYTVLPEFDIYDTQGDEHCHQACGYGYLAGTNEYKVVRIYKCAEGQTNNFIQVEVYTLGSGKGWRHVGKFDLGFQFHTHCKQTHGVFLNGCLHWRNTKGGMVVVFDLAEEKFRDHIPPPPMLPPETDDDGEDDDGFILGVSGGGILYYAVGQGYEFDDVWLLLNKNGDHVMEQQEEHQLWGWKKVSSLQQREPFAFTEVGTVLRYNEGTIKVSVPTTASWIFLGSFSDVSRQVFRHKHTLISLKELGEENAATTNSQWTDSSESGSD